MKMSILLAIGLSMSVGCVIPPGTVAIEFSVCGDMPDVDRYTVVRSGCDGSGRRSLLYNRHFFC